MRERGVLTPFIHIARAYHYPSLEEAKRAVFMAGEEIRQNGIAKSLNPLVVTFTSMGDVSKNALAIFKLLPAVEVKAEDLATFMQKESHDAHMVYYVIATQEHMVRPKKDADVPLFSKPHYYAHPEQYEPIFHEQILPHTSILMQCMYWESKFPRLVTISQAENGACNRLIAVGELACDIRGPVEFLFYSTSINDAYFLYDVKTTEMHSDWRDPRPSSIVIYAVDHIPSELATDATNFFGNCALPYVPQIAKFGTTRDASVLDANVLNALEVHRGAFTAKYGYLQAHIDEKAGPHDDERDAKDLSG